MQLQTRYCKGRPAVAAQFGHVLRTLRLTQPIAGLRLGKKVGHVRGHRGLLWSGLIDSRKLPVAHSMAAHRFLNP